MNIAYLDALPGLRTDIDDELGGDEKGVFTARLSCFGTETDQFLGGHSSRLYLTNRRIIADNTVGLWSVDLVEDVADCEIVERGIPFLKSTVVRVGLNRTVTYGDGHATLRGFRFYLKSKDGERFAALMDGILG